MTERMFLDRLLSRFAAASIDLQAAVGGRYGPIAIEDAEERYSVARQRIIDAVRDKLYEAAGEGNSQATTEYFLTGEEKQAIADALMVEENDDD